MQSRVNAMQYIIMYYSRIIIIIIIIIISLIIMYYSRPYWDSWLAALAVAVTGSVLGDPPLTKAGSRNSWDFLVFSSSLR